MRARGADVIAIDVGAVGHEASMLAAAPLILKWLQELEHSPEAGTDGSPGSRSSRLWKVNWRQR
jgi:hypothetical protein